MCKYVHVLFGCSITIDTKGILFSFLFSSSNSSSERRSHVGSLVTNEEPEQDGSWRNGYSCHTVRPCLRRHGYRQWQHLRCNFRDFQTPIYKKQDVKLSRKTAVDTYFFSFSSSYLISSIWPVMLIRFGFPLLSTIWETKDYKLHNKIIRDVLRMPEERQLSISSLHTTPTDRG